VPKPRAAAHRAGTDPLPPPPRDGSGQMDLDHGKQLRPAPKGAEPSRHGPSPVAGTGEGWWQAGQASPVGPPRCPPSPGSSGVPQPTQTQALALCEAVPAVHVSQDLSSPHSPAKAEGKG